jgi:hypothetical protein
MKNRIKLLVISLFVVSQISAFGQTLNEKLKFLEPMLGNNWVGEMKSPDGKKAFKVNLSYESMWNGTVIKFSRSNPELNFFSEGYIYWDDDVQKLLLFSVSSRGGADKGDIIFEDGKITIKGNSTIKDKTFDYKNTFEFTSNGKMIDRWFQNAKGSWQPGHTIEFHRVD